MSNLPPPPLPLPVEPVSYASVATGPTAIDAEHLRLLALFHYIWGGITALFSSFALFHVGFGIAMIANPGAFAGSPGQPPPPAFMGWMFLLIGGVILLFGWTIGGLTIYSGRCLSRRRRRTFSLVMAGVNCLSIPIGTILGVITIVVLLRESVKAEYEYRRANPL